MSRTLGILRILALAALVAAPTMGEEPTEASQETRTSPKILWSATTIADFSVIDTEDGPGDIGGFFDQYDFTPNKNQTVPVEIGVRDATFDWIGSDGTPYLQLRYFSPTSNLGVSGSEIDDPFFNQRLDAYGRRRGLSVDLYYRRIRTEELRVFPNTAGGALVFDDRTAPSDRFTRERTGFETELRIRPVELLEVDDANFMSRLAPEISVRGSYDDRDGLNQLNFLRSGGNDWLGIPQQMDHSASNVGGGVLVAPWGLMTLVLDFDHERFRWNSEPILEGQLGFGPPASSRAVDFVPNTNQSRGSVRLSSQFGDRVRFDGGLQLTQLEQTGEYTPDASAAGLNDNSVTTYSANAAFDVQITNDLSFETLFKFGRRNNDIDRDTALFNPDNGTQVDGFVRNWKRYVAGGEFVYRMRGANSVALGVRYEDISRDVEFAEPSPIHLRIVPANALVNQDTRMTTVYGRTVLRPLQGLSVSGEVGYRNAPRTGYIIDLDDYVYGNLRASYVIPLPRVVVASAYVRGSSGQNHDFDQVSGVGAEPPGPRLSRYFDRSTVDGGITLSGSPIERLSLFASLFFNYDEQEYSLVLSNLPRYYQDDVAIFFSSAGTTRYQSHQTSLILGGNFRLDPKTDGSFQYAYTRTDARFGNGPLSSPLQLVSSNRQIDSEIHGIHLELRRTLRTGMRLLLGYGLQIYDDHAPVPVSVASSVTPFDESTLQHRVTLGVTLTQDLFEGNRHASAQGVVSSGAN